ncbi:MAG: RluA family pseudouridine synthase [Oscillospiraceae bacterium]|nr:RluA family pseudouridine synthase [Oscillospiraceae bacterium]
MKEIVIKKDDSNQRLDKFLTKFYPRIPVSMIYKSCRKKRIKINYKKADFRTILSEGDIINLYLNDEFLETNSNTDFLFAKDDLNIIYQDQNILLVDKPVGLVVHADETKTVDTLINRIKKFLFVNKEYNPEERSSFTPSLCNRIDRNTAGIVIAAKNAESLRVINQKIRDREIEKKYLAVVWGRLEKDEDIIKHYMIKDENNKRVSVYNYPIAGGKTMITSYKRLDIYKDMTLIEVSLITGRTHQIRSHFSHIGHPLVGDLKYGEKQFSGAKHQLLYSYKVCFNFIDSGQILDYINKKEFIVKDIPFLKFFNNYKKEN